jgi:hypothetical protein
MATMTYIGLLTSCLYGTSFIASISFYVLVVGDLQSLLLVFKRVVINLQFSMSKDFRIFLMYSNWLRLIVLFFWSLVGFDHYLDSKEKCEFS